MPRRFFEQYTRDLTPADFQRLFTRDTPEAYRFFARTIDRDRLALLPWYRRWPIHGRLFLTAFAMRLSPARRMLFAFGLIAATIGMVQLFRGFGDTKLLLFPFSLYLPTPHWAPGGMWLFLGFVAANLLILMEVADRLSLKGELEVARDIQIAMLPEGIHQAGSTTVFGVTRPANTVGGDFYDIIRVADGRLVIALGDVAGKGSPAALLMALLVAMLRTLVDEGLESARLVERLNVQVARHSPASRFITLFYGLYDPRDGTLQYVNAGHLPPIVRHGNGTFERLAGGGLALGILDTARYAANQTVIGEGDLLVLYSDGITEAETPGGRAFEESGVEQTITRSALEVGSDPEKLCRAILRAVEAHAGDARLADDLTVLVLQRA